MKNWLPIELMSTETRIDAFRSGDGELAPAASSGVLARSAKKINAIRKTINLINQKDTNSVKKCKKY